LWGIFGEYAHEIALIRSLLQPKMQQISFGGPAPPVPTGGAYSTPPNPIAGLRAILLREGKKR